MKDVENEALLLDFYGGLLKDKQREIYEASVMDDMSLAEISEEYGISRQAVSAMLTRCRKILNEYEEQLKLIGRFKETEALALEIKKTAQRSGGSDMQRIAELCDKIIGEL